MRLITHLSVIANNTARSIGGLGERRQPAAPEFTKLDDAPPSTPQSLQSTAATPQTLALTWSASSDDTRVTGYDIFSGEEQLGETFGATSVTLTGLRPRTAYTLRVRARDGSRHVSGFSAPITASTQPLPPGHFIADFDTPDETNWSLDHAIIERGSLHLKNWGGTSRATLAPLHAAGAFKLTADLQIGGGAEANALKVLFHVLDAKNLISLEITGGGEKAFVRLKRILDAKSQLLAEARGWQNERLILETDTEGRISVKTASRSLFSQISDPAKIEQRRGSIAFAGSFTESSLDNLQIEGAKVFLPSMSIREARQLTPSDTALTLAGIIVYHDAVDRTLVLQDGSDAIWLIGDAAENFDAAQIGTRALVEGHIGGGRYAPTFRVKTIHLLGAPGLPAAASTPNSICTPTTPNSPLSKKTNSCTSPTKPSPTSSNTPTPPASPSAPSVMKHTSRSPLKTTAKALTPTKPALAHTTALTTACVTCKNAPTSSAPN